MSDEPESLQTLNSLDCWDYSIELECLQGNADLQLAAELGKTLLERNKELENAIKQYQTSCEDQAQEIEYLTKQNVALREVNESRLRIYEQLEVSIQDLERTNHRLLLENSSNKKQIKTLKTTIEGLEAKCEELQSTVDDLTVQVDVWKNRSQRTQQQQQQESGHQHGFEVVKLRHVENNERDNEDIQLVTPDSSVIQKDNKCINSSTLTKTDTVTKKSKSEETCSSTTNNEELEVVAQLENRLENLTSQCGKYERMIREMEEHIDALIHKNVTLESQLNQKNLLTETTGMKSVHEELNTLEEVRQGQLCNKCLRNISEDENQVAADEPSLINESDQFRSSFYYEIQNENHSSPIKMPTSEQFRASFHMDIQDTSSPIRNTESLYKNLAAKYEALVEVQRQPLRTTCSEAGTSSSGFADETCNKETQTEEDRVGSFLCTIADATENCKLSIYQDDAAQPRETLKARELMDEVLTTLKRIVKEKEEIAEKLPALDEIKQQPQSVKVMPTMPQLTDLLANDDDGQSVMSSTLSELSTSQNEATTVIENIVQAQNQPIPEPETPENKFEPILRPLIRQPLEDSPSPDMGKRSSSRRRRKLNEQRSDSPVTTIIGSPKISYAKRVNRRRRDKHNIPDAENTNWNGNTVEYWASKRNPSPTPSQSSNKSFIEFKPSSASQDLSKLKQLDRSYADVVRLTSKQVQYRRKK